MTDTTEETTGDATDATPAERHKAFKLKAAEVLHAEGQRRDWCDAYDDVLVQVGLPVRERFNHNYPTVHRIEGVVGEETDEAFEVWRRDAIRILYLNSKRSGLDPEYVTRVMNEAGFEGGGYQHREVFLEGKFRFPITVEVLEGDDLISGITDEHVMRMIRERFHTDQMTWKAVTE